MASRSHVDVNERRLRPIYDCLDNGNNRKAIQEADKVLKKQKDFQCAKVLKALALLRLGRQDESSVLLQEVHGQHPTDDATLQAMSICYREVHKLEAIADLYENAHKARPDNEEILSALFMAHVRLGSYKKQQQTAMALHKLRPSKNPYYFWAVMSNVMQAHSSPDPKLAKTMYLPLAERMTKKYVDEDKIDAEAEVLLYLMVLELQDKWQEAVNLLEGPLGERVKSELNLQPTRRAELSCKLCKWDKANAIYRTLLQNNPDHWQFWLSYLNTVFQLIDSGYTPPSETGDGDTTAEGKVDSSLEEVMEFINQQINRCKDGTLLRGPYLAQMELVRILQERKSPLLKLAGPPSELFEQYYNLFGGKPCCARDLKAYICLLTPEELQALINKFVESSQLKTENGSPVYASDAKHICQHMTVLQLSRLAGLFSQQPEEELLETIRGFVLRYRKGLDLGKDLLQTDIQPSDQYLLFAAHLLVDLWQRTGEEKYVWQAVVQLELGVHHSPANHQFKLLLMRLYCEVGAFGPVPALWNGMDMKHIMNDSLGYFISNHVGRLGHLVAACAMFGTMLRFFSVNHKETTEYLLGAYKYGSFGKIREFVDFRDRLQRSVQYKVASTERLLLDLILETNCHANTQQMLSYIEVDPSKERAVLSELRDNRDFTAMECWDPPSQFRIAEYQEMSFKEEKAWLHCRDLILRILVAAVMSGQEGGGGGAKNGSSSPHNGETLVNGSSGGGVEEGEKGSMAAVVQELLPRFVQHTEACAKEFTTPTKYPIQGPYRTRITTYLRGKHHILFVRLVECFLHVYSLHDNGLSNPESKDGDVLKSPITDLLKGMTEGSTQPLVKEEDGRVSINVELLEQLVISTESLSFATTLIGVCCHLLRPLKTSWSKQSRKKKAKNPPQPAVFDKFTCLVTELQDTAKALHKLSTQFDPVFTMLNFSALSLTDPLTDNEEEKECEKTLCGKMERSFQQSSHEICELLHNKLQYLHTCHI
ncbi:N-alpha-acetyltransferase 25, NatB auxiliary subunit-like isoform X2 [Babylonia areolata]|uniref:N-alpha-acetyltransferase 25, NatB auxiliary subunit-like isoform X2 n=1 Tax=Babylonia areolata TaxID=304850 RepID=UPI003FD173A0